MANDAQARASSISFRQLKLFESIGRVQSVRRASEECALSQPAVTQALAKLEEQVGVVLVDRRASGSYLNKLGQIFHARVTRFFDQMGEALVEVGVTGGANAVELTARRLSRSQVRVLVAIVEKGSFADAADALDLSQPSLQRAARDLEGNLRRQLFHRTADGTMVTPAGLELGRRLKLALQEIEWGVRELDPAWGGRNNPVVVGAMPFGGSVLLASVLDEFLQSHPQADVRIITENAADLLRKVKVGDVDFVVGLVPEAPIPDLSSEALAQTPYSIVGRRGHPLTRKGRVSMTDLLSFDWVAGNPGANRRICFDTLFADGPGPKASIATCATPVIRHLLARSDRLTLMTSYELVHGDDGLGVVPFGPLLPVPTIGVTMRANWRPTRLHADFIDILRRHMAPGAVHPLVRQAS